MNLPATWLAGRKVRLRPIETDDRTVLRRFGLPVTTAGSAFIIQTREGKDVGVIGFDMRAARASIGLRVLPARWRDGVAADALRVMRAGIFKSLPLIRLEALVPSNDIPALLAFRRAGFKREGVLREVIRVGRQRRDAVVVSAVNAP
ncbi:MAG TPA: GNAT family protein [Candidatus Eremiobacteraceae bacterium]|nr:GNAT family protein [Candidatus Eremiobacteraceae bacterium]